jgi:hypothetical protein
MDNPFVWGNGGQQQTPDQNRMAIVQALLQQGQQPANNVAQGAANAISSFTGGYLQQQARNAQSDPFAGAGTDPNNPVTRPDNQSSALLSPASQIGGFLSGLFHPDPFAGAGTAPSGTTGSGW